MRVLYAYVLWAAVAEHRAIAVRAIRGFSLRDTIGYRVRAG